MVLFLFCQGYISIVVILAPAARLKRCCPKWSVYGLRFRHSGYEAKHWPRDNQNGLRSIDRISRHHLKMIINCQHMIIMIFVADEEMETSPAYSHTTHSDHRLAPRQVIRNERSCYWIQMRGKSERAPVTNHRYQQEYCVELFHPGYSIRRSCGEGVMRPLDEVLEVTHSVCQYLDIWEKRVNATSIYKISSFSHPDSMIKFPVGCKF